MPSIKYTVFRGDESGKIYQDTVKRDDLSRDLVLVKITHSGICYIDTHVQTKGIALGHEGVGVVERVGPDCKYLKVGQPVGWGCQRDTCGHCDVCLTGDDVVCPDVVMYTVSDFDQGTLASRIVLRESFLVPIPPSVPLESAGPLMCGGVSVFEAMTRYGTKPTDRVGVVGLSDYGHFAVQFLAKMGCEVVVFSGEESKKDDAMKLGASEFYVTEAKKSGELSIGKPLNQLYVTSKEHPDWNLYVPVLAPHSTIYPLTFANAATIDIPQRPFGLKGLRLQGTVLGSRHSIVKMLDFCGHHGIKPMVQTFPMSVEGIEEALLELEKGSLRYSAVLAA